MIRLLTAAAIAAGLTLVPATGAEATCTVANIEICDKPTDPYTDPIVDIVSDNVLPVVAPYLHIVYRCAGLESGTCP